MDETQVPDSTSEAIQNEPLALYRLWGSADNGRIEFESLSDETLEGALYVMKKSFFMREPISMAVNLLSDSLACDELIELCLQTAKDGVSIVAVDIISNQVVGVLFNKIQVRTRGKSYFQKFSDKCERKASKALLDFMINVDSRVNLFKHYRTNCIFEHVFLATLPEYGRRQIGELMLLSSLQLARELKLGKAVRTPVTVYDSRELTNEHARPFLASAIMTSAFSQRIASKLQYHPILEDSYDNFQFEGVSFSQMLGPPHHKCVLVVKEL